ncbi:MAG: SDR family NAD(P)-dependent oxidoreductase [Myxococcota bacterium]|nr:glucose 1-dehydrogenase [Deltaproteobacteria bacterium]MCP4244298.1 SDR family NAD(P)-dependent oxidoreductase [bacterium]MDP6074916.1 SDR family NAD(P)-dependent oxidoreductase [Myxococcota bacterium]MBT40145.1 glucose 1-dehydrogenase [Deltaproteobacteria bacterium]MDP6241883.1 SDR family NAD(P)-dependent oxidoreductase [Myxococcota bacterium]
MTKAAVVFGVGADEGVGAALCRRFAREGLHVFPSGRTPERVAAVAGRIREAGGAATAVAGDATDAADVEAVFDAAECEAGVPELVVFNVGNNRFRSLLEMDDAFFEGLWRVCCFGGFLVGRAAARRMVPVGAGSLIFTGATASLRSRPPFTAFASAKAGLRALAHGMAREFGPQGLHVGHVVIDGVIDGNAVNSRFPQLKERLGADGMLAVDAIAEAYWNLHRQDRSAWTLELDLRPHKEPF